MLIRYGTDSNGNPVKKAVVYTKEEHHRHDVRPGLTGLAQINGRNSISWEEKFKDDIEYVNNITFAQDIKIILKTFVKVFKRDGINQEGNATMRKFEGTKKEKTNV